MCSAKANPLPTSDHVRGRLSPCSLRGQGEGPEQKVPGHRTVRHRCFVSPSPQPLTRRERGFTLQLLSRRESETSMAGDGLRASGTRANGEAGPMGEGQVSPESSNRSIHSTVPAVVFDSART